jgi:hypothetical protein
MNIKTLNFYSRPSLPSGHAFNDILEKFFDTYNTTEDVECYQIEVPDGDGYASVDYLTQNFPKYTFQTRVVILNIQNMILDQFGNIDLEGLAEFCASHHEQQFIIFNDNIDLRSIKIRNLYADTIVSEVRYNIHDDEWNPIQREKKKITNQWLFLNNYTRLHKTVTLCYLLSKDYYRNGLISMGPKIDNLTLVQDYYVPQSLSKNLKYKHNISKINPELKREIKKGYERFRSKDFNKLESLTSSYDRRKIDYYDVYLGPFYETTGVEIIAGSRFFEQYPIMNGKLFRSVYAKNFPIHINGVGITKWMKEFFDLDIFEDIVDHSYDEITDHFERLTAAIDRNTHLLDGSTNIHELWHDNQKRFEDNCEKMDNIVREGTYRTNFNHEKIKKALLHFGISVVNKSE